jgi:tetratricopeptide (TPR) repeat protein
MPVKGIAAGLAVGVACLAVTGTGRLAAVEDDGFRLDGQGPDTSVTAISERVSRERLANAANFRIAASRARNALPPGYDLAAELEYARSTALLAAGRINEALAVAEKGYQNYPFSPASPALAHNIVRCFAASGRLATATARLSDLWERYPGYEGIAELMEECLIVAERIQRNGVTFDLDASNPKEVVDTIDLEMVISTKPLFKFLLAHGDTEKIAPRARLALCRNLLAEGGKDRILEARLAYDGFLSRYPKSDLVFAALAELAVSHLVTYRGDEHDIGVLIDASALIDRAELYTRELPDRVDLVQRYRRLIRRWSQQRDMTVADWYCKKCKFGPAKYYYQAAINRDPDSELAREARRAIENMPGEDDGEGLGEAVDAADEPSAGEQ